MSARRRPERTPAELVRELRGDLSHDRFAEALGTTRQTVIRWEKGTIPETYAQALSEYSSGRYSPEDFNPRLALAGGRPTLADRLIELENSVCELEERVRTLERDRRRSRGK